MSFVLEECFRITGIMSGSDKLALSRFAYKHGEDEVALAKKCSNAASDASVVCSWRSKRMDRDGENERESC